MSQDDARSRVTKSHIDLYKKREAALADIRDGRLPTLAELYQGSGFAGGDVKRDIRLWASDLLLEVSEPDLFDRLQHLHDSCSTAALIDAMTAIEHYDSDAAERIDLYLAADGDIEARQRVACRLLDINHGRPDYRQIAFGLAVVRSQTALTKPEMCLDTAQIIIQRTAADIDLMTEVAKMVKAGKEAPTAEESLYAALEAIEEDRAEIDTSIPPPKGLIVVPLAQAFTAAKGHRKDILSAYTGIIGATLPYALAPDPIDAVERFRARLPHAVDAFVRMLGHHQKGDPLHLGYWLLVGPPGTGKTTFIRTAAEILAMPCEVHGMAGASDSSIMGTSSQWSTARSHPVLQLINQHGVPNPIVGWDEIEKVGEGRHNGNALDALLPILERHTAKKHRDLALEVEVDLSAVSHIATANSLEGIPKPILDRFRIIRMPEPEWQHIGTLSRSILDKLATERGLDPRWFPDLAGDELEALQTVWNGGSIRRLEQALKIMVEGRDKLWGQA